MDLTQLLYAIKDDANKEIRNSDLLKFVGFCLQHSHQSEAQNYQDVWALWENYAVYGGYFVEFGATDGKTSSNTYLLEKMYNWSGILAEPNPHWHDELAKNRSALISHSCVFSESNQELDFLMADSPDLSTIRGFGKDDEFKSSRENSKTIKVQTISLYDLLDEHMAPKEIDFMSVDTEGSEYGILNAFFQRNDKYVVNCITVEHNNTMRSKIFDLMTSNGYVRKFQEISRWDDFYILKG